MAPEQPTPEPTDRPDENSPEHRAAVVAGIRALADFVESRTDLPVPHSVAAQHSFPGRLDQGGVSHARELAARLGVEPDISDTSIHARTEIASGGYLTNLPYFRVTFTLHGFLAGEDGGCE